MEPIVELRDVSFGYGSTPVLNDINLHLHPGQFAGVVGPSGAGKTSLLRLTLGTLSPTRGEVLIAGQPLRGRPAPRVSYVPQVDTIDWNFPVTVEQVVLMGRVRQPRLWPWPSRADKAAVLDVLDRLQIADLRSQHIRNLSGGQQQRVFLARALVAQPDLLVLDEPTSGVDMQTAEKMLHLLLDLNHAGHDHPDDDPRSQHGRGPYSVVDLSQPARHRTGRDEPGLHVRDSHRDLPGSHAGHGSRRHAADPSEAAPPQASGCRGRSGLGPWGKGR